MGGASSSKRPKPPSQPLELYAGKLSPPSRAVWLYILQNNLPIDVHEIDILKGETKTDEFTKLNPHQAVPVLKDRDVVVRESQAIIRYLAHRYTNFAGLGASTSPKNPNWEETSKIDATVCWLHTTFYPDVFDNFVKPSILPALPEGVKEAVIEIGEKNTKKHLDTLEKVYFEGKDFLCGGQPTVADIFGGVFMSVLELKKDFDLSAWPKVSAWFLRVKQLDHWATVHDQHRLLAKNITGVEPQYPEPPKPEPPAAEPKEDAKPSEENPPAEEKPAEKQETEEKPAEEKPAEEKPAEEKPAEEKPAEEKPAEEKPAEEKPTEEQPAEEKPAEEQPAEEKPAEDKQEETPATEEA